MYIITGVCPEPRINVLWLLFFKPDPVNTKDLPPDQTPKMPSNIYKAEVQVVYKDKILNFRKPREDMLLAA